MMIDKNLMTEDERAHYEKISRIEDRVCIVALVLSFLALVALFAREVSSVPVVM